MQDILSTKWTKNEIFANQKLNTNDFGKIRMLENGFVYANLNFAPIGNGMMIIGKSFIMN